EIPSKLGGVDVGAVVAVGPRSQSVDITNRSCLVSAVCTNHSFGIHQVGISKSEHREISIRKFSRSIASPVSVHVKILVFRDCVSVIEVGDATNFLGLFVGIEHLTPVL